MSKITDQLDELGVEYSISDNSIFIPKTIKISNAMIVKGGAYIIKLLNSILNPPDTSTLASNWNNGIVPKYNEYAVEVVDKVGNMIKVYGVACEDDSSIFSG